MAVSSPETSLSRWQVIKVGLLERATSWMSWVALTHLCYLLGAGKWPLIVRVPAMFALVMGLLSQFWLKDWRFWGGISLYYFLHILYEPYWLANHHYVLFYTAIAMTLAMYGGNARRVMQHNARMIIIIVMGMATIQKLLSPSYRDGSFFAYMLSHGDFGEPLWFWHDGIATVLRGNTTQLWTWFDTPPGAAHIVTWPWGNLTTWGLVFSWLTIAVEGGVAALAIAKPRGRLWAIGALSFVWSLMLIRQELMFIAIVTLLSTLMLDDEPHLIRWKRALVVSLMCFLLLPFILRPLGIWTG